MTVEKGMEAGLTWVDFTGGFEANLSGYLFGTSVLLICTLRDASGFVMSLLSMCLFLVNQPIRLKSRKRKLF